MQRLIKVDGKVRTDATYPTGFMDVITIEKTGENFRLVYDTKGRFTVHRITAEEVRSSRDWNTTDTLADTHYRLRTSWARSSGFSLGRAASHSWLRTMHEREFSIHQTLDQALALA
jgi:hypothetical protein